MRPSILLLALILFLKSGIGYSQDTAIKIGIKDSVQSKILNENRQLMVSLPKDYDISKETYPVLFLLDGTEFTFMEGRVVTYKLGLDMIIVAIANTDRDRDMMPLSRPSYEVKNPEADNFISFLENELIPHIDKNYRTNGQETIRGKSLSGLFVMYAFISNPTVFDNYIGNCAGWFADMNDFFNELTDEAFQNKDNFTGKKLFVANSLSDPLDPNQEIHQSVVDFSMRIQMELDNRIKFEYMSYENAGHIPYASFYDGMKFIFEENQ